jgi:hypothetical protein
MERNSLHEEMDATYTIFERDGRIVVRIDSSGSADRQIPGKAIFYWIDSEVKFERLSSSV